jgi:membrane-associated phospholipid phosphatase
MRATLSRNFSIAAISRRPFSSLLIYLLTSSIFYAWTVRHPLYSPWVISPTWIDEHISFTPDFVPLYLTYLLIMPSFVILSRRDRDFGVIFLSACAYVHLNLVINACIPTTLSSWTPQLEPYHWGSRLLLSMDAPNCVFPAGHVGLPTCIAARFYRSRSKSWRIYAAWAILMSIAALTTKQHFFPDVVAGALLGFFVGVMGPTMLFGGTRYGETARGWN